VATPAAKPLFFLCMYFSRFT